MPVGWKFVARLAGVKETTNEGTSEMATQLSFYFLKVLCVENLLETNFAAFMISQLSFVLVVA